MFFAAIIYFLIICNLLYLVLKVFFTLPDKGEIIFDSFSYQYIGFIMTIVSFMSFLIKDFGTLIKISQNGIFLIFLIIFYIIYLGLYNLSSSNVNFGQIHIATSNFTDLFGIFLVAFFVHHVINQVMKKNRFPSKDERDLKIGFITTTILYSLLGVFGAFAIAGRQKKGQTYNIFFDYFEEDKILAVFEFILFLYLTSLLPILW